MKVVPISFANAKAFVAEHHRHSRPPVGWKFGVGLEKDGEIVGVGIASRPVARHLDDGRSLEITRICTLGGENHCSTLYASLCRAAKALGYTRVYTYTLECENGSSVKASGFKDDGRAGGGEWSRTGRPRQDAATATAKRRWIRTFGGGEK